MSTDFPNRLQLALTQRPSFTRAEWEARPAAVLVPFYWDNGEWHLLFTQRTQHVESHKGQVSFPGGRADPEDVTRIDTALREAEEEIGLKREQVAVLGQLDELLTVTQYRVTPVVGVFPWPYEFVLSTFELSEAFGVPLRWLADPANLETQYHAPMVPGPAVPVYHFRYQGRDIWGATARIVLNLLEVVEPLLGEGAG